MSRELLDEQVNDVEDAGGTVAGVHLREERPAEEIVALAEELGAYLIVGGNRCCGGIRRVLTGSVFDRVTRHAPPGPRGRGRSASSRRCPRRSRPDLRQAHS
jgi:nucleotide-binding universal stress UspA family protein